MALPILLHDDYHVAWICALHIEMAAACAMLDVVHQDLPWQMNDSNSYSLVSIGHHNVVIACLPASQYGTNNAAIVLTHLMRTFRSVRVGLMVGIGGAAPGMCDIRLGDVVVGTRVMQVDLGKMVDRGHLRRTATARIPASALMKAVTALRSKHELKSSQLQSILRQKFTNAPEFMCPDTPDHLYYASYNHASSEPGCNDCEQDKLVPRSTRPSRDPTIHYGGIASGNQVMRSSTARDLIARELDVVCFEMEAAGLMDIIPCLPIRGICDYSDSHKNKDWQKYAAAVAAAYAAELLTALPGTMPYEGVALEPGIGRTSGIDPASLRACHIVLLTREASDLATRQPGTDSKSRELRGTFLKGLSFKEMNSRRANIERSHAKTCEWFLDHSDYRDWLDPDKMADHHGFLWIKGKPGVGKSTIMKFAYLQQRKRASGQSRACLVASFFFNARGDYLERSVLGMCRSLLLQLLEAYPDLQQVLDDRDLDPENSATYENLIILKEVFFAAVLELFNPEIEGRSDSRGSIYLFIDALDECDEQQAIDMVQYFEELADECTEQEAPFRICLSSRHYPYIIVRHGLELVLEVHPGHTKDLQDCIGNRLRIQDQGLARDLQADLLRKAGGIFLWVILAVNILNTEDSNGRMRLRSTLDEIPDDLHTLFKSILLRDGEKKESLLLGIIWILFSKRPLNPLEYYHALWSGLMLKGLADPDVPSTSAAVAGRFVISSTKGFAEVAGGAGERVQFIHESVRDFLIKDRGLQQLWPDLGSEWQFLGEERLKESCEAYLSHPGILSMVRHVEPGIRVNGMLHAKFPFVRCACEHVFDHANTVAQVIPQDDWMSRFAPEDWKLVVNHLEVGMFDYKPGHDILYALAELGYADLIRTRLKANPDIAIMRGRFEHPFFAALADGGNDRKGSVAALLGSESHMFNGMDVTEGFRNRDDLGDFAGRTPLTWAAEQGRLELIELMIRNGESIDEEDSRGCTPLGKAMDSSQISACKLLIEKGADPKQGNSEETEYITWASGAEQLGWVELLYRKGVSLAVKDRMGRNALCAALYWGDDGAISFLVDKGAADHVCGAHGLKLILWCIRTQRRELAESLLSNGFIISQRDRAGRLLLARALGTGEDRRIMLLATEGEGALLGPSGDGHYLS